MEVFLCNHFSCIISPLWVMMYDYTITTDMIMTFSRIRTHNNDNRGKLSIIFISSAV